MYKLLTFAFILSISVLGFSLNLEAVSKSTKSTHMHKDNRSLDSKFSSHFESHKSTHKPVLHNNLKHNVNKHPLNDKSLDKYYPEIITDPIDNQTIPLQPPVIHRQTGMHPRGK